MLVLGFLNHGVLNHLKLNALVKILNSNILQLIHFSNEYKRENVGFWGFLNGLKLNALVKIMSRMSFFPIGSKKWQNVSRIIFKHFWILEMTCLKYIVTAWYKFHKKWIFNELLFHWLFFFLWKWWMKNCKLFVLQMNVVILIWLTEYFVTISFYFPISKKLLIMMITFSLLLVLYWCFVFV